MLLHKGAPKILHVILFHFQVIENSEVHVWKFVSQIANGLHYLHSKHYIHRDIKPSNIIAKIEEGEEQSISWKLADFGLAKRMRKNTLGETTKLSFVGTLLYMAPEALSVSTFHYFLFPLN